MIKWYKTLHGKLNHKAKKAVELLMVNKWLSKSLISKSGSETRFSKITKATIKTRPTPMEIFTWQYL